MKKSKIKGYIYDLEHKNKNFSFDKAIRILDISNAVYIDMIKKFDFKIISDYRKSKYMFKEITNELEEVSRFLDEEKTLMAVCLLRNVFEEMTYIMATSVDDNLDIHIMTKAGYFNEKVMDNCIELLGEDTDPEEIKELYSYLSKITHVTNVKEAVSYITGNKQIKKYINNEIKFVLLIIENMYLSFLNKRANLNDDMCNNIMSVSTYVEFMNLLYFVANLTGEHKRLETYFYGDKNKKYMNDRKEQLLRDFKEIQLNSDKLNKSIIRISKELDKQLADNNYMYLINKYFNM